MHVMVTKDEVDKLTHFLCLHLLKTHQLAALAHTMSSHTEKLSVMKQQCVLLVIKIRCHSCKRVRIPDSLRSFVCQHIARQLWFIQVLKSTTFDIDITPFYRRRKNTRREVKH